MADVITRRRSNAEPSSGLAIYVTEHGGELYSPVLLLVDEDNDFKFVDCFVSQCDVQKAAAASSQEFKDWGNDGAYSERKSLKSEIDLGQLTRIGPMPRKHVFYRRGW